MSDSYARIAQALAAGEARLEAALKESRARLDHPGTKGDQVEIAVRHLLAENLPPVFSVDSGEVVDRNGTRTRQLDVVINNSDQCFGGQTELSMCEGVAACGEVKSRLGSSEVSDIVVKAKSVKRLRYTHTKTDQLPYVNDSDLNRYYVAPPFFGVALESSLTLGTIAHKLATELPYTDGDLPALDAVFVVGRGMVINVGDGKGDLTMRVAPNAKGWLAVESSDSVLVTMLSWLHAVMPRVWRGFSPANHYFSGEVSDPTFYTPIWDYRLA